MSFHQRALPQQQSDQQQKKKKAKPISNRSWDDNVQALRAYKEEYGDLNVKYMKDPILSRWIGHTRENYHQGQLAQDRIDELEALGFVWNPHEKKWLESYARLVAYWKEHGHTKVPATYANDKALGRWVARQRDDFSGGHMAEHRRKKLDAIGFVFRIWRNPRQYKNRESDDKAWEERYADLVEYHKEHGHTNVPRPETDETALSKWVGAQRTVYARGLMKPERVKKLNDLGFIFNFNQVKKQEEWNRMYEQLKICRKIDGSFQVSVIPDEKDQASLSRWMMRQKEKYKNYKMEPHREQLLRMINFPFPSDRPPPPEAKKKPTIFNTKGVRDDQKVAAASHKQNSLVMGSPVVRNNDSNTTHHNNPNHRGILRDDGTSMVSALIDLAKTAASDDDENIGEQVATSVAVLAKVLNVSQEEIASRVTEPLGSWARKKRPDTTTTTTTTATPRNNNKKRPASPTVAATNWYESRKESPLFGTLMPLIVSLRDTASDSAMQDCVEFLVQIMNRFFREKNKPMKVPANPTDGGGDMYNTLLTLAMELKLEMDNNNKTGIMNHHHQAMTDCCVEYFSKILKEEQEMRRKIALVDDDHDHDDDHDEDDSNNNNTTKGPAAAAASLPPKKKTKKMSAQEEQELFKQVYGVVRKKSSQPDP